MGKLRKAGRRKPLEGEQGGCNKEGLEEGPSFTTEDCGTSFEDEKVDGLNLFYSLAWQVGAPA